MRIVYVIDSVSEIGGIQSVTVQKANALAEIRGNDVWIIVSDCSHQGGFTVSDKVHFVNLSVNYYEDDWKSEWHVLKGLLFKRRKHKKLLSRTLHEIKPDVVISTGTSEKFFILNIKGDWAIVREIHSIKDYRTVTATTFFQKILAIVGNFVDYKLAIRRYDKVVVLTNTELHLKWSTYGNVIAIPNPVMRVSRVASPLTSKRVVAAGRLVPIKDFSSLIRSFKLVADRFPDWKLDIWGEGPCKTALEEEIRGCGLFNCVILRGTTNSVQQEFISDSIFVCTSMIDGFGLVLLEAMSCGLPVVSYDCDYGPREIIDDGRNGFLVPVGDELALADRICSLIEDEGLRKQMGAAAFERSKDFSMDRIIGLWMDLFTGLLVKKSS